MKLMRNEDLEKIGFNYVLSKLNTLTPYGTDLKKKTAVYPKSAHNRLLEEFTNIGIFIGVLKQDKKFKNEILHALHTFRDIKNTVKKLHAADDILDEVELFEIKTFMISCETLRKVVKKYGIKIDRMQLPELNAELKILNPDDIILGSFKIYDSYSEKLKEIRKEKLKLESELLKESGEEKTALLRDKRFQTVIKEQKEEDRIRRSLTEKLRVSSDKLSESIAAAGQIDFVMAKAMLAHDNSCVMPEIASGSVITIKDGINPAVKEKLTHSKLEFIPISIEVSKGTNVITGANMGGKSVSLATITLNVYLGLCGFYVFAKKAKIPHLDFVFFLSDDMQSVSSGLSTFGAEIVIVKDILEVMKTSDGFFALDEFAKGTNPHEGRALVRSFFEYLTGFGTVSLMTTHFDGVLDERMTHYQVIGLSRADLDEISVQINTKTFGAIQKHMDYRLEKTSWKSEVSKEAIRVARMLGLEEKILNRAQRILEDKGAK
jgi:DNA mismatch repair protein MutS2